MTFSAPHFSHPFNGIIWRMEIDPVSAALFAEIRNEQDKQVSFASVNLASGKINFQDLVIDERWLTGMEGAYNGVLFLHHYQSAASPEHKGIIAVDSQTGKPLWADYNKGFDHISINGPVLFDIRMQPRKLFVADAQTGQALHPYNPAIDTEADLQITLPDMLKANDLPPGFTEEIPFGNIIHNLYYNGYRIVSLHAQSNAQLSQCLYIFEHNKPVFNDLLNTGIQKLQPEAFVLHRNHLIYLKNRSVLNVINL